MALMCSMDQLIVDAEDRRKAAGMSVSELCRRGGFRPSTWRRWLSGQASPTFTVFQRVIDVLPPEDCPRASR